jgi:hypothetical protein
MSMDVCAVVVIWLMLAWCLLVVFWGLLCWAGGRWPVISMVTLAGLTAVFHIWQGDWSDQDQLVGMQVIVASMATWICFLQDRNQKTLSRWLLIGAIPFLWSTIHYRFIEVILVRDAPYFDYLFMHLALAAGEWFLLWVVYLGWISPRRIHETPLILLKMAGVFVLTLAWCLMSTVLAGGIISELPRPVPGEAPEIPKLVCLGAVLVFQLAVPCGFAFLVIQDKAMRLRLLSAIAGAMLVNHWVFLGLDALDKAWRRGW